MDLRIRTAQRSTHLSQGRKDSFACRAQGHLPSSIQKDDYEPAKDCAMCLCEQVLYDGEMLCQVGQHSWYRWNPKIHSPISCRRFLGGLSFCDEKLTNKEGCKLGMHLFEEDTLGKRCHFCKKLVSCEDGQHDLQLKQPEGVLAHFETYNAQNPTYTCQVCELDFAGAQLCQQDVHLPDGNYTPCSRGECELFIGYSLQDALQESMIQHPGNLGLPRATCQENRRQLALAAVTAVSEGRWRFKKRSNKSMRKGFKNSDIVIESRGWTSFFTKNRYSQIPATEKERWQGLWYPIYPA